MTSTLRRYLDAEPEPGLRVDLDPLDPEATDGESRRSRFTVLAVALVATVLLLAVAAVVNPGRRQGPVAHPLSPAGLAGVHVSMRRGALDETGPVVAPLGANATVVDLSIKGASAPSWQLNGLVDGANGVVGLLGQVSIDPGHPDLTAEVELVPNAPTAGLTFLGSGPDDQWAWMSEDGLLRLVRTDHGVSRTIFAIAVQGRPTRLTAQVGPGRFVVAANGLDYAEVSFPAESGTRIGVVTAQDAGNIQPVVGRFSYVAEP